MTRSLTRALGLAMPLILAACAGEYRQSSLSPASDFAATIHDLYTSVFWWTVLILAVVWILLGYILIRFRARPGAPTPKQTHGHLGLEVAWTIGPAMIVVAIAVPTIQAVFQTQRADPAGAYEVEVIGHQFWWEFRYPEEGIVTANELYLPVGRPVSLRLHSADVIHSFWVPQLGGKRDVNPLVRRPEGELPRYNWLHFTVAEPGVYMGQCAEFCGLSHALMGTRVIALPEAEFDAWVASWPAPAAPAGAGAAPQTPAAAGDTVPVADTVPLGPPVTSGTAEPGDVTVETGDDPAAPPPAAAPQTALPASPGDAAALGRQVFLSSTCVVCHTIVGTPAQGALGPSLSFLGRRLTIGAGWLENDEENLVRWITDPGSIKPGVLMPGTATQGGNFPPTGLTEEQVRQVAAYLLSLR